jgi:hypothetical protein
VASCEVCGNDYDKAFEVVSAGRRHIFDSLECASIGWRQCANTATARSSDTVWRRKVDSSVAPAARAWPVCRSSGTGPSTARLESASRRRVGSGRLAVLFPGLAARHCVDRLLQAFRVDGLLQRQVRPHRERPIDDIARSAGAMKAVAP